MEDMSKARVLQLNLLVPSAALSPSEFMSLFECAEGTARSIIEQEAAALLEYLEFSQAVRLQTMQELHRLGRRIPTPTQVTDIRRGSWIIGVDIPSTLLIFVLLHYVHPTVKEAFEDSRIKQRIVEFLRDRVFDGILHKIEGVAIDKPRYGNLKIQSASERPAPEQNPTVEIRLERQEIYEVGSSDEALIEDFIVQIREGRRGRTERSGT